MKQSELKYMQDKAAQKKDGIYSFMDWLYGVQNNRAVIFCNKTSGEVLQCAFGFLVHRGKCEPYEAKKQLTKMLKEVTP